MDHIRPAELRDLPGIYRVCLQTGNSGDDATAEFADPDLLGHVFTGPFVLGEPGLAFVVADEHGIGGYALACADEPAFAEWAEEKWWPSLRQQYAAAPRVGVDGEILDLIFSPPRTPHSVSAEYPAEMHIDLALRMRGSGHGRALIQRLLAGLKQREVRGLHLEVSKSNGNAIAFYEHLGFTQLQPTDLSIFMGIKVA
ncbi:MAG: GNAT family N-acetyltransferase [Lacisediminihabitans sp.]